MHEARIILGEQEKLHVEIGGVTMPAFEHIAYEAPTTDRYGRVSVTFLISELCQSAELPWGTVPLVLPVFLTETELRELPEYDDRT